MTMIPAEIFAATIYREVGKQNSILLLLCRCSLMVLASTTICFKNFIQFSGVLSWSVYLIHGLFRKRMHLRIGVPFRIT
jgi:hypothetical protein